MPILLAEVQHLGLAFLLVLVIFILPMGMACGIANHRDNAERDAASDPDTIEL